MLVPLILFAVCLCPRPPPQSTARMSTPTPNSVMHSRRIRMIQNRVRDLIDKIDPAAISDDRSSLVANPVIHRKTDPCESGLLVVSDICRLRVFHHPIDTNRLHSLVQPVEVASRDDLDLMSGLACDRLHIREQTPCSRFRSQ